MSVRTETGNDVALARIAAHCRSLDPEAPTARARLDEALGAELAAKLVFALASGRPRARRAASRAA